MNIWNSIRRSLRNTFSKINLIDKCLMLIMFLLLIQSAHSLFFNTASSSEVNTIDIIIRTATASIFGYFLSSNFIRHPASDKKVLKHNNDIKASEADTSGLPEDNTVIPEPKPTFEPATESSLQIIVTTSIAIFCLLILVFVRNTAGFSEADLTPSSLATISQFRDLVSGCIGFLIGVPAPKNDEKKP